MLRNRDREYIWANSDLLERGERSARKFGVFLGPDALATRPILTREPGNCVLCRLAQMRLEFAPGSLND